MHPIPVSAVCRETSTEAAFFTLRFGFEQGAQGHREKKRTPAGSVSGPTEGHQQQTTINGVPRKAVRPRFNESGVWERFGQGRQVCPAGAPKR